jgi:hypothetical protein
MVTVPLNTQHEPTVYRPETFEKHYEKKLDDADRIEKNRTISEKQGVYDLHPEIKQDMGKPSETKEPDKPSPQQVVEKSTEPEKPRQEPEATIEAEPPNMEQREPPAATPVNDLASSYAQANPDAEATPEDMHEAAYFAHSVEDPEKYTFTMLSKNSC